MVVNEQSRYKNINQYSPLPWGFAPSSRGLQPHGKGDTGCIAVLRYVDPCLDTLTPVWICRVARGVRFQRNGDGNSFRSSRRERHSQECSTLSTRFDLCGRTLNCVSGTQSVGEQGIQPQPRIKRSLSLSWFDCNAPESALSEMSVSDHALNTPCNNYSLASNYQSHASDYVFGNPYLVPLVDPTTRLIFPAISSFLSNR